MLQGIHSGATEAHQPPPASQPAPPLIMFFFFCATYRLRVQLTTFANCKWQSAAAIKKAAKRGGRRSELTRWMCGKNKQKVTWTVLGYKKKMLIRIKISESSWNEGIVTPCRVMPNERQASLLPHLLMQERSVDL